MMAKMSWLPANRLAPMAVDAPNFAVIDLFLEQGERMLIKT
jgi:hypothetical protein